jgi:hypothetical protein
MFCNYQKNRLKSDAIPPIFENIGEEDPIVEQFQAPLNDSFNNETETPCC